MKLKIKAVLFCFLSVLMFSAGAQVGFAQTSEKFNYRIFAHTIVGSNAESAKSSEKLSSEIAGALKKLDGNFGYTNFRKLTTHFQLIESGGGFSQRGIVSDLNSSGANPSFASWNFDRLEEKNAGAGQKNFIGFRRFNFTMNLPVNFSDFTDKQGKPITSTKYESVNLTLGNFSVPLDEATVFATLPIDTDDTTLFFIIKVSRTR